MAVKIFLIFVTLFAYVEFLGASPTRRQLIAITEATASDSPVTNDGAVWDDNDEFDLDGQGWYSQPVILPSAVPEKTRDYNEYDEDYNSHANNNVVVDFADDDDDDEGDHQEQDGEEDDDDSNSRNDSEFMFLPPRDTRLVLEDDDDDQSGPIKVRHTGRSSYPRIPESDDNTVETTEEDKDDSEHPYEFAIDEDDKDEDDDDEDDDSSNDSSAETMPRHDAHEDDDDEDEFVSEGEDGDMFENPEEEAAQVIYGDHVFLY